MTKRETNLAIAVAVLLVAVGAWLGWGWWSDAVARRVRDRNAASVALGESQLREAEARAAVRRLQTLRERSLPDDPETAQAAYRDWLVSELSAAGIVLESIRPLGNPIDRGAYTALPFDIQATGPEEAVVAFLHAFYSSPATHKVTQLKLTPEGAPDLLRIDLDVEAIVVRGAVGNPGLPTGDSGRLALAEREAYLESIASRSLFTPYEPPPPPPPPRPARVVTKPKRSPPPFDDSTQAHFTAAVGSGGDLRAWVLVRTKGERLSLSVGDDLRVGQLVGQVVAVEPRLLVYEAEGRRYAVPLGASLREGSPIDPDRVL